MVAEEAMQIYNRIVERALPVLKRQSKSSYIGAAIALFLASEVYKQFSVPRHLKSFPRVSFLAFLASLMRKDSSLEMNEKLVAPIVNKGHKIYAMKIPFSWSLSIADPELARSMLLKSDTFPKSQELVEKMGKNSLMFRFMGVDNVAFSNGHTWKRQRKFMNPAFRQSAPVKTFGTLMYRLFDRIDERPQDFPVSIRVRNYTLDVLGVAGFNFDFKSLSGDPEGWSATYDLIIKNLFNPWSNVFHRINFILVAILPSLRESSRALDKFNKMLVGLANKRREEIQSGMKSDIPESEKDLLTLMCEAEIKEGAMTTNDELRENIALFFLAGHDTTGNALSYCLYNLAKDKNVQNKLRQEILDVMAYADEDAIPTMEDLKSMPYLNMVIKENLRHSGPVGRLLNRVLSEDIVMDGHLIPKGTKINVDVTNLHYNPKYWHSPEQFIPERFEENGEHDNHPSMAWLPFSNGTRQCIGMNFSLIEQKVFLAMLLRRYEVSIPKGSIHSEKVVREGLLNFAPDSLTLDFTRRA